MRKTKNFPLWCLLFCFFALFACTNGVKSTQCGENTCQIRYERGGIMLSAKIGQFIEIMGKAFNAKSGAMVLLEDQSAVFLDGLLEWPEEWLRKEVRVKGRLTRKKLAPDPVTDKNGAVSTGAFGSNYVLEEAEYHLAQ